MGGWVVCPIGWSEKDWEKIHMLVFTIREVIKPQAVLLFFSGMEYYPII